MFTLSTLLAASGFLLTTSHALQFADSSCAICPPDNQTLTDCGQRFGSCYDFCAESRKEFPIPECNGVSGEVLLCEYFKSDCGEVYGGCYNSKGPIPGWAIPTCPPEPKPETPKPEQDPTCQICVDNANDCGQWYGECYDFCAEQRKELDIPECNGVSGKKEVCEYMKNECGKVFGGCYPAEGPIPGWAVPACP